MGKQARLMLVVGVAAATVIQLGAAGVVRWWCWREGLASAADRESLQAITARLAQLDTKAEEPGATPPTNIALPAEVDVPATLQVVQAMGDANGVALQTVKAGQSGTAGKQTLQITGTGSSEQICGLLADIERGTPLLVVETGRLAAQPSGQVVVELGLATFHRTELR